VIPTDEERERRSRVVRRVVLGLALAALSAIALTAAFPPYGAWPLVVVGFVPLLVAQHRVLPARLSAFAPALAIGGFIGGYVQDAFSSRAAWYMRALPVLVGALAFLANLRERRFHARTGYRAFILLGAFGWVGVELARSFVPVLGTWGIVAYALYDQPWLLQPVSVLGVWGLGLLIMLINYTFAQLALALFDRMWRLDADVAPLDLRRALRWAGITASVLLAWIAVSSLMLASSPPAASTLRVAALQPGVAAELPRRDERTFRRELLARLVSQTREAAGRGAKVIVWPEGAIDFDVRTPTEGSAAIVSLAREAGAILFVGSVIETPRGLRNEVTGIGSDGAFLGTFGKDHPVGFLGETSVTGGTYPVYETPVGPLGSIICYDLDFTDTARRVAAGGAELIAVPSWDWPGIAAKHYTHVVFRAIENRVAIAKAEHAYDSAIVDPYGRILARAVTPEGARAILVADVPMGVGSKLAGRAGDAVGWLCLAAVLVRVALQLSARSRASKPMGG